ncbi:MAG: hypothetical protein IV100_02955 [Myxococcales bacterium]|nr:hypothetical protein [Myxococcales bacterium]
MRFSLLLLAATIASSGCGSSESEPESPSVDVAMTDAAEQDAAAPACTTSADCTFDPAGGTPKRLVCVEGACVPCSADTQCAPYGESVRCYDGGCYDDCGGRAGCACPPWGCAAGFECAAGQCTPSACTAAPGGKDCPCANSDECDAGLMCIFGTCGTCLGQGCDCESHAECDEGEGCFESGCTTCPHGSPGCPCDDGLCDVGSCNPLVDLCVTDCPDGTLGCPCELAGACVAGLWCSMPDLVCQSCAGTPGQPGCPCPNDGPCAEGAACGDGGLCEPCPWGQVGCPCIAGNTCAAGARCDALANRCTLCQGDAGCPCTTPNDCAAGHRCTAAGVCEVCPAGQPCTCVSSAECPDCLACVDGACTSSSAAPGKKGCPCGQPGDGCTPGTVCTSGTCTTPCNPGSLGCECDGEACFDGSICQAGQCQACTPACAGKACGPDGCGESCGTCPSGPCTDGACTPSPLGSLIVEVAVPAIGGLAGIQFTLAYDASLLHHGPAVEVLGALDGALSAVNTDIAGKVIVAIVASPAVDGPFKAVRVTFAKKAPATLAAVTVETSELVDATYQKLQSTVTLSEAAP